MSATLQDQLRAALGKRTNPGFPAKSSTVRQTAQAIGISPASVCRFLNGHSVSGQVLDKIEFFVNGAEENEMIIHCVFCGNPLYDTYHGDTGMEAAHDFPIDCTKCGGNYVIGYARQETAKYIQLKAALAPINADVIHAEGWT